jgi:hypothetical protein
MGKFYGTEAEYTADLKKHGLEPYSPKDVRPPANKNYAPSQELVNLLRTKATTGKMSDNMRGWMDSLVPNRYKSKVDTTKLDPTKGGFA